MTDVGLAYAPGQHVPHDNSSILAADSQQGATAVEGTRLGRRTTLKSSIVVLSPT